MYEGGVVDPGVPHLDGSISSSQALRKGGVELPRRPPRRSFWQIVFEMYYFTRDGLDLQCPLEARTAVDDFLKPPADGLG